MNRRTKPHDHVDTLAYAVALFDGAGRISQTATTPDIGEIGIPFHLLIGFSIENALKALLEKHSHQPPGQWRNSHDLSLLQRLGEPSGLRMNPSVHEFIDRLGRYHSEYWFRYAASLMPAKCVSLIVDVAPSVTTVVALILKMPSGGWQDNPQLRSEIRRSVEIEAQNVMRMVRRFVEVTGYPVGIVRKYLWLTYPTVMARLAEYQIELGQGDTPLSVEVEAEPKRIASNLPPDERVHAYVEAAGMNGIGAYEIANRTNGRMKRDEVEEIAYRLEDSGLLYTAEARTSNRGRTGVRLYPTKFGKPLIGSDGRRIPPLAAI